MPVDPDISQSTAGGGYHPGLDPDYDPDQVSSRPSAGAEPRPKPESDLKFKKQQQKEEKFNPTEDSPVDPSNKNSDGSYRSAMARESREADKKTEQKRQASKKLASKDSSAQDGGSHRPGGGQKALEQVGQSKGFTNSLPGGGGGKPGMPGMPGGAGATGAKGAGGGKAAAAEAAVQGLQKGLQKVQQGDIKGGAEDAAIGAIEGAGSAAASAAFKYLASPPAIAATFTLSIFIGWNLLLIAPRVLKGILKTFTKKEIDIKLETWQRYVIIAMDVLIAFIIFLCFVVATAAFCYSLTSPTLKDRLYSFAASPAGASAGELGRFFMPQEVVDFCGKLTGNATSPGSKYGYGGNVSGNGDTTDPNWVPVADSCGSNPAQLCKPEYPNDRCTPDVVERCNSPEYEDLFTRGLDLYYDTNGKGIDGVNMLVLVKSIASVERKCQRTGVCSSKSACGMMQFIPGTAALYAPECRASVGSPYSEWANDNPVIQVCMAAHHLEDNADRVLRARQTPQVRDVAACYNSGEGRCGTSKACLGSRSCDNSPTLDWECGCVPSGIKTETWPYARKVSGCYYNAYAQ